MEGGGWLCREHNSTGHNITQGSTSAAAGPSPLPSFFLGPAAGCAPSRIIQALSSQGKVRRLSGREAQVPHARRADITPIHWAKCPAPWEAPREEAVSQAARWEEQVVVVSIVNARGREREPIFCIRVHTGVPTDVLHRNALAYPYRRYFTTTAG